MPKEQLTKQEQVIQAIEELKVAMLAKLDADQKYEEASQQVKKAHYDNVKARQRLESLDL